jgi:hypothetical protein
MNTTTPVVTSYKVVPAMFDDGKFEVEVHTTGTYSSAYLRNLEGTVRLFGSRSAARKAITRAIRQAAGEPLALHR